MVIVSHDRYFMDKLVDHLLVFEGDAVVRDYPGNYSQYRIWQDEQQLKEKQQKQQEQVVATAPKTKNKPSFKDKHEFEQLEKEIPKLEREKRKLNTN